MKQKILYSSAAALLCLIAFVLVTGAVSNSPQLADVAQFQTFQFPMNGSWLPNIPKLHVGHGNYTDLVNLRPTDTGHETIDGFSDLTTTDLDTVLNSHQFTKEAESHIIVKTYDGSNYELYENTTAVPGSGDFDSTALYTVGSGDGSFANGPQGTLLYVDSENALIWGGDEMRIAAFLTSEDSDADGALDFSSEVSNSVQSEFAEVDNIFSAVVLLLSMDGDDEGTTFTDASNTPHTVTANGGANTSTDFIKFGSSSAEFDGSGGVGDSYLSAPDSNDWSLGSSNFTFDFWFRNWNAYFPSAPAEPAVYEQYVDANNYVRIYLSDDALLCSVNFEVVVAGVTLVSLSGETTTLGWKHVAIVRNSNDFTIYINGVSLDSDTYAGALPDLAAGITIGYGAETDAYLDGYVDEFRITKGEARWTADFETPTSSDKGDAATYFFIGSPLKINSFSVYLSNPNSTTSTIAVDEWTGDGGWVAKTVTDGTTSGGVSFAQDGTVSWEYSDDAEQRFLNGRFLYWYRGLLSAGVAGVYNVQVGAPLQPIRDVWNGSERTSSKFIVYWDGYNVDFTFAVEAVDSAPNAKYAANIGSNDGTTGDYIIAMFDERSTAISASITTPNQADAQIDAVYYWNGVEYVSVGNFEDGTLDDDNDSSFNKSGTISWSPVSAADEKPKEEFGIFGYSYKITTDGALTPGTAGDGTQVDYIGGITAPKTMSGYDFVTVYANRVMLVDGNRIDYSQTDAPWIFNGIDSFRDGALSLYFGEGEDIVGATPIYNRYGSNIIEGLIVLKEKQTFILTGVQPYKSYAEPFVRRKVSDSIGCVAPRTIGSYEIELEAGVRMKVAVWLDYSGPVYFNGATPSKIPGVENFFNPSSAEHINYSYMSKACAYVDHINDEWNLLFPTGDSTTNNKWIVYNYKHKKWYEKAPSVGDLVLWDGSGDAVLWDDSGDAVLWDTGKYPVDVVSVRDSDGALYNYGFLQDGSMMRLDHSSTWDSAEITQHIRTGLFSPPTANDEYGFWTRSTIRGIRLISEAITENRSVLVSVLIDGVLSDNSLSVDLDSGKPISKNLLSGKNMAENGEFYQVDFITQTSVDKWRPLAWGYKSRKLRED